jgi:hypothetical protein
MAKNKKKISDSEPAATTPPLAAQRPRPWLIALVGIAVLAGIVIVLLIARKPEPPAPNTAAVAEQPPAAPAQPLTDQQLRDLAADPQMPSMPTAQAVMATVELNFGSKIPSIAEALKDIERRYLPDDGQGRTFALLDAYGEPTADGKLHLSMHVSSEKPGAGFLIFRRTGEVLWKSKIVPATNPPDSASQGKVLVLMLNDDKGKPHLLDGSKGATSIMDAVVNDYRLTVREFWPDGDEREVVFFYSTCGCPVKVMARRVDEKTVRTSDQPVIFPDDSGAAATIARLMGWQ